MRHGVDERLTQRLADQLNEERARLEREAGLSPQRPVHFRRPTERPFTAADRHTVTILFGGLTVRTEQLIRSVFRGAGYRIESLPVPTIEDFQAGKEYGNNGQCNPTYFTTGALVRYLQRLAAQGLSRQDIVGRYVYFTAGTCGPCRFGMYEAEYRLALQNAGFDGFRVVLFQQEKGVRAQADEPGLTFNADFGMGALNAMSFSDLVNDLAFQIRPYEVEPGNTDTVVGEAMAALGDALQHRAHYELEDRLPAWLYRLVSRKRGLRNTLNTLGKAHTHFYGLDTSAALSACRDRLDEIEVDRLQVKPIVKVTGEFWAQTTEGDGNFQMFAFLEREGAEVLVEPLGNWIMYLLWQARARHRRRKGLDETAPRWWRLDARLASELRFRRKLALLRFGEATYSHLHHRAAEQLGGTVHPLLDMDELAELASPYYDPLSRGGEGHLEVAKNIYYTVHRKAHMVLSLKPFGCMPSTQSDGVQSAVMSHFPDMTFLPIETSGEGAVNAYSRVQMTLGEARAKARAEFQEVLASTGKSLDELRDYVARHRELRRPFYPVPARSGVTGTAARFALHVSELVDRKDEKRENDGPEPRPQEAA